MISQSGLDLRKEVFGAMRKCSETFSSGKVIENITQTRRLMTALNTFYHSTSSEKEIITKENSNADEVEIATSFTKNTERLPINFDLCWLLNEQRLGDLTAGYVILRFDLIPHFVEITSEMKKFGGRSQLHNALLITMRTSSEKQSSRKHFQEFYRLHALKTEPLPLRSELRFNVFESLRMCSETFANGRIEENVEQTRKLLTDLCAFYEPLPFEKELITLDNSTADEIEIVTFFLNNNRHLPIKFDLCSLMPGKTVREFAVGFAALRIEFLPQFVEITTNSFYANLDFVIAFEEAIGEELFIRKKMKNICEEKEDWEEEEKENEYTEEISHEQPQCVRTRCTSTEISLWKRNFYGKLLCNTCYHNYRLDTWNRTRASRTLTINGVLVEYSNLTRKLLDEYSLDD